MKIQEKPDYLIFAQDSKSGELLDFPDVSRGWGITIDQTASKPPMEWMNGAFNRIDKNMLYLLQQGVPDWSESVKYPANAIIKYDGIIYIAKVENESANPISNVNKWTKLIPDASTEHKGIVQLSSAIDSDSESQAATAGAVKKAYNLANTANTTANTANTTANTAKTNAATAQTKADSAYTLASTANTTANTAKSIAETNASTTAKGRVQLNSAVNSTAENQAATPKAVKTAYDLAASKLTANQFPVLLSENGYQKLSSGLVMQWGKVDIKDDQYLIFSFPIAFPTACLNLTSTLSYNKATDFAGVNGTHNYIISKSQFGVGVSSNMSNAAVNGFSGVYWFAIGY